MIQNLVTNRLDLKPISIIDLENIHELHSLTEVDRFNTLGIPKDISVTERIVTEWIINNENGKNTNFTFKIKLIHEKSFIGLIALNLGNPKFKSAEV